MTTNDDPKLGFDATLVSGDTVASAPSTGTVGIEIAPGTTIGRYRVLAPLGSGAMGVVVSAFDATLDRKVALKLVRSAAAGEVGQQRLLREAQAMARLSHPNVVTVFEAGMHGDGVFIAMEYIAGATLGEWLATGRRSRQEILAIFTAAGQGLAAAHHAGIVHRDFKPANVLVSAEGRARVADFGLATSPSERAPTHPPLGTSIERPLEMTTTGTVMGTPAYMAPEQHRGEQADTRADQFALCVALYEALYRELPFGDGRDRSAYVDALLGGRVREPRAGSDVPAWLRRVLVRGMSASASARYPSIELLLAELARDPARRARQIALAGGVVAVIAGLGVYALTRSGGDAVDPCATADAPFAALWNAADRARLESAFRASGSPMAATTFPRVAALFDRRAGALRTARREACVATAVRHDQSADLLDRRMQCLDERGDELASLVAVLTDKPTVAAVEKSIGAAAALAPVEDCAERDVLLSAFPPPATAELRARVATVERSLDRAHALENTGKVPDAAIALKSVLVEADAIGYPPLTARAHYGAAANEADSGAYTAAVADFRHTAELAAAAHDDALLAEVWIRVFALVGFELRKADDAKALEPTIVAALTRAGRPARLRGIYDNARGAVAFSAGNYGEAGELWQTAARELASDPGSVRLAANALSNAGTALESSGRLAEARDVLQTALVQELELLGPQHPALASTHHQLGSVLDALGDLQGALEQFRAAKAISEVVRPGVGAAADMISLGVTLNELEQPQQALDQQLPALALLEHDADAKPQLANALLDVGVSYLRLGKLTESSAMLKRALDLAISVYGPDHPETAKILDNLAQNEEQAKRYPQAEAAFRRALAIRRAAFGPAHPDVLASEAAVARTLINRHKPRDALAIVDKALADAATGDPVSVAVSVALLHETRGLVDAALGDSGARIRDITAERDALVAGKRGLMAVWATQELGEAQWNVGRHAEAIATIEAAYRDAQAETPRDEPLVAKLRKWLDAHPKP